VRARLAGPVGALIAALLLAVGCGGGVTPGLPSGPSQPPDTAGAPGAAPGAPVRPFPSLTGRWRTSGTRIAYRNIETGIIPDSYNCEGSLTIDSQDGSVFSGTLNTTGHGWNSDRFCTGHGTLTGHILSNDGSAATARLDGAISANQCTFVQRGSEFTGVASDAEIRLQRNDIMRCPVNLDGGPGMPLVDFERTVTLAFARW
jgi:hypothetical protein